MNNTTAISLDRSNRARRMPWRFATRRNLSSVASSTAIQGASLSGRRVGARGRSDWTVKPDAMAICSLEAAFVRCRAFAGNFGVVIGRIFHMFSKLSYRILPRLFFRILPRLFFRVFPWLFFRGVSRILSTACIRLEKRHETSVESYAEMQSLGIPVHHQDGKAGNSTLSCKNSEQTPITGSLRFVRSRVKTRCRQRPAENSTIWHARG